MHYRWYQSQLPYSIHSIHSTSSLTKKNSSHLLHKAFETFYYNHFSTYILQHIQAYQHIYLQHRTLPHPQASHLYFSSLLLKTLYSIRIFLSCEPIYRTVQVPRPTSLSLRPRFSIQQPNIQKNRKLNPFANHGHLQNPRRSPFQE